jgi:subtilisin family serine protease
MGSKVRAIAIFIAAVILFSAPGAAEAKAKKKDLIYKVKYAYGFASTAMWAQDRINQGYTSMLDGQVVANNNLGSGIDVYLVDSGIGAEDCSGHGSLISSIINNEEIGIVRSANIISKKVLDCNGETTESQIINVLNLIRAEADPSRSVVNISIGGPKSQAIDNAVNSLGLLMPVVVAAGNESANACNTSPAGAKNAITVSGLDNRQYRALFANHGPCVDIWAPGRRVDAVGKDGIRLQISGTSAAAPFVTSAIVFIAERDNVTTMQAALTMFMESSDAPVINGYYSGKKPFSLWIREVPTSWIRTDYPSLLP